MNLRMGTTTTKKASLTREQARKQKHEDTINE
jgi:hypothetical protein